MLAATSVASSALAQAERRWVVDNAVAVAGDGSPESPFATLAEAVKAAGDTPGVIVLRGGTAAYAGGIALRGGQSLIGEGAPIITIGAGAVVTIADTTASVNINNVVLQATGAASGLVIRKAGGAVTLQNVAVTTTHGPGITVSAAAKVVISGESSVASIDGPAVTIEGAELDVAFRSLSAKGELTHGILLHKTTGRFTVEGKEGAAASGGTIDGATARAVSVIDATNVTLRSMHILRSASTNGVAPVECGGNLAAGSNEGCNAAVYLRNAVNVALDGLVVDGSGQAGVVAHQVNGLTVTGSTIRNAGNETFEHALVLEELQGDCRIAATTVERSASRLVMLHNSTGRLSLVIERSTFRDTAAPTGQQGALISAAEEAVIDVRVSDSTFARTFSHALDVTAADNAKVSLRVTGSTFDRNASAVSVSATHAATVDYWIADNPSMTGSTAAAINVFVGAPSSGTVSGTIARNVIGKSGESRSGAACDSCSGIRLAVTGDARLIADVTGNIVQQTGGSAIQATASEGGPQLSVTASANLLREGSGSSPAIRIQSGALPDDAAYVCADLGGGGTRPNTIQGNWDPNGAIHLVHRLGNTRFLLAGLAGANTDVAAADAVSSRNGNVKVRAVLRPDSMKRGFEPVERCTMPALKQ
jgi:hypothetical protein